MTQEIIDYYKSVYKENDEMRKIVISATLEKVRVNTDKK